MTDDVKALIAEAREFADRGNGLNWQGRIRELADALEASVQVDVLLSDEAVLAAWTKMPTGCLPTDARAALQAAVRAVAEGENDE